MSFWHQLALNVLVPYWPHLVFDVLSKFFLLSPPDINRVIPIIVKEILQFSSQCMTQDDTILDFLVLLFALEVGGINYTYLFCGSLDFITFHPLPLHNDQHYQLSGKLTSL